MYVSSLGRLAASSTNEIFYRSNGKIYFLLSMVRWPAGNTRGSKDTVRGPTTCLSPMACALDTRHRCLTLGVEHARCHSTTGLRPMDAPRSRGDHRCQPGALRPQTSGSVSEDGTRQRTMATGAYGDGTSCAQRRRQGRAMVATHEDMCTPDVIADSYASYGHCI